MPTLWKTLLREWVHKPQTGRKYSQNMYLLKGWYPKYIKTQNSPIRKQQSILKWVKDLNRHLTKEDIQMANELVKTCSTSYVIRKLHIKTTMRCHEMRWAPRSSRSLFPIPFSNKRKQTLLKKSSILWKRWEIYKVSLEHYIVSNNKVLLKNKSYSAEGMSKGLRKQLQCSPWPKLEQLSNKVNSTKL